MNCHCGKRLKPVTGKPNLYKCQCGCRYRLVITRKSEECSRKEYEARK